MLTPRPALFAVLLCMNGIAAMAAEALEGSRWILAELPPDELLSRVTVTLIFDEGRVEGTDGCNRFRGPYTAGDGALSIGTLAATMRACPEPVMDQARNFLAALDRAHRAEIVDESLQLLDENDKMLARFDPEIADLADTRWNVTGYNNGKQAVVSAGPDASMTLEFDAAGAIAGHAGCNNFRGSYSADADTLTVTNVAATRRLCEESVMERESAFLEALERSAAWRAEGGRLELRDEGGAMLVIAVRAESEPSED